MIPVDVILQRFEEFPTLPTIYMKISDLLSNPYSTFKDAADLISRDQASATKILKAANSPIYGIQGRIDTISQAISYIGFEEVKNLVLALSIIRMFNTNGKDSPINPIDLWKHSIAVGVISREIAKATGVKKLENYFLAGILHDIGKLFFYKFTPREYSKVIEFALENNLTIREAEKKILGITHIVCGEMIAEKWKLPNTIRNSIRHHSSGTVNGNFDPLVACVHIADISSYMLDFSNFDLVGMIPRPNPLLWDNLDLREDFFTKKKKQLDLTFDETVSLLLLN